jgi:chromate reductase, NAD(P)H dehydrogenase (quinone)
MSLGMKRASRATRKGTHEPNVEVFKDQHSFCRPRSHRHSKSELRIQPEGLMSQQRVLHVVGVAGSLRQDSLNRALLRAAHELQPEGMSIGIFDLAPLPLYNQDDDDEHTSNAVRAWRDTLWAADALLIATPEYNHGVPGVLKNALDWASRPPSQQPLNGLPVALMGASPSMFGTARAQMQLRQTFVFPNARLLSQPEVFVSNANDKFDPEGYLTDPTTRQNVRNLLLAFAAWTRLVGRELVAQ